MIKKSIKKIDSLIFENKRYIFKFPLEVDCEYYTDTGEYFLSHVRWNVFGYGLSLKEAWEDFADEIDCLWEGYALSNDKMTEKAVELKKELLEEVEVENLI